MTTIRKELVPGALYLYTDAHIKAFNAEISENFTRLSQACCYKRTNAQKADRKNQLGYGSYNRIYTCTMDGYVFRTPLDTTPRQEAEKKYDEEITGTEEVRKKDINFLQQKKCPDRPDLDMGTILRKLPKESVASTLLRNAEINIRKWLETNMKTEADQLRNVGTSKLLWGREFKKTSFRHLICLIAENKDVNGPQIFVYLLTVMFVHRAMDAVFEELQKLQNASGVCDILKDQKPGNTFLFLKMFDKTGITKFKDAFYKLVNKLQGSGTRFTSAVNQLESLIPQHNKNCFEFAAIFIDFDPQFYWKTPEILFYIMPDKPMYGGDISLKSYLDKDEKQQLIDFSRTKIKKWWLAYTFYLWTINGHFFTDSKTRSDIDWNEEKEMMEHAVHAICLYRYCGDFVDVDDFWIWSGSDSNRSWENFSCGEDFIKGFFFPVEQQHALIDYRQASKKNVVIPDRDSFLWRYVIQMQQMKAIDVVRKYGPNNLMYCLEHLFQERGIKPFLKKANDWLNPPPKRTVEI